MRQLWEDTGDVYVRKPKLGTGRKRIISPANEDELRKFLELRPDAYIKDMCAFLHQRCGLEVNESTVWRTVNRMGLINGRPRPPRPRDDNGFWSRTLPRDENDNAVRNGKVVIKDRTPKAKPAVKERVVRKTANEKLVERTAKWVEVYMAQPQFDASHDFKHVQRVAKMARHILAKEREAKPSIIFDPIVLELAALMHDVDDHKYAIPSPQIIPPPPDNQQAASQAAPPMTPNQSQGDQSVNRPQQPTAPDLNTPIDQQSPNQDRPDDPNDPTSAYAYPPASEPSCYRPPFKMHRLDPGAKPPQPPPGFRLIWHTSPPPPASTGTPSASSPTAPIPSRSEAQDQQSPHQAPPEHKTPTPSKPPRHQNQTPFPQHHQTPQTIESHLLALSTPPHLAHAVHDICSGVSYTTESTSPAHVQRILDLHPELAILQDADRLDALGAVGVGRAFTYGGAKTREGGLEGTIAHFEEKLLRLPDLMKTEEGRRIAAQRVQRVQMFRAWFEEEAAGFDVDVGAMDARRYSAGGDGHSVGDVIMENGDGGQGVGMKQQHSQPGNGFQRADMAPGMTNGNLDPGMDQAGHGVGLARHDSGMQAQMQVQGQNGYVGVAPMNQSSQQLQHAHPDQEEEDPGRQLMVEMYGMR